MAGPNFELITELQSIIRRDFPVASASLLEPLASNPLIDGEWLELNGSQLLVRGSNEGSSLLVFPVHTERGRYDTQAIGKANVLFAGGMYQASTKVVDTSGSLQAGDLLTVQDVTIGGLTRRGLKKKTSGASPALKAVVGIVTKVISSGQIEFVSHKQLVA